VVWERDVFRRAGVYTALLFLQYENLDHVEDLCVFASTDCVHILIVIVYST
jgi:hypothetical protein